MNDPTRLSAESESDLELALLRAGRHPAPPGAKHRAWLAASSVAGTTALAAGTAAAGSATSAGSALAKAGTIATLKLVVGVTSVAAVTGAVAYQVAYRAPLPAWMVEATPPRSSVTRTSAPSTARIADSTEPAERAPAQAVQNVDAPSAALPQVAAPPASALQAPPQAARPTAVPSANGATVATELALLDRAHVAIAAGAPAQALALLDDYVEKFPHGTLEPEATVLRVEALVKAGDRRAAGRAAESLLANSPDSPYARRIESLLTTSNP
jgi:TolA-binding protein